MALFLKHLSSSLIRFKPRNGSILYGIKLAPNNDCRFMSHKETSSSKTLHQPQASERISSSRGLKNDSKIPYEIGQKLNGFVVTEIEAVPEFQLTAIKLVHKATGGQYLHINREDSNNAFSVMFRTTPTDSTGLPHILEHTTLCGSEKFPCRDPFFKMLNRSLATFMNAITAPDYTMYPFSTQNQKDFENLMSVYFDAVFKPQLKELDFQQEGWRLEHGYIV